VNGSTQSLNICPLDELVCVLAAEQGLPLGFQESWRVLVALPS